MAKMSNASCQLIIDTLKHENYINKNINKNNIEKIKSKEEIKLSSIIYLQFQLI